MGLYVGIFVLGFFLGYLCFRAVAVGLELVEIMREEEQWR
jgi:hypothetical protein